MATDKNFVVKNGLTINGSEIITSAANLTNVGTINSGAITSTSSITAASGGNVIQLGTDGNIEITRTSGNAYIDFKDSTSEDYDQRIQATSTGHSFSGTISSGAISATGAINSTGTGRAIQVNGTTRINSVGDIIGTSYYIGSTNIIDTSRNLTNIGTINSGAIDSLTSSADIPQGSTANLYLVDTRSLAANTGGSIVFSSYFQGTTAVSGGSYIKGYKENATSGDYGYGLKFGVRENGQGITGPVFTLNSSGNAIFTGTISSGVITSSGLTFSNGGDRSLTGPLNQSLIINARPNDSTEGLKLRINGVDKLSILQDGNATFAGTIDSGQITITQTHPTLFLQTSGGTTNDAAYLQKYNNDLYLYNKESAGSLFLGTNNSTKVTINSSGNATFAGTISSGNITSSGTGTFNTQVLLPPQGTATSTTTAYESATLAIQGSGWDTNNALARTGTWTIKNVPTASVYPDFDLNFYEEGNELRFQLHGRGTTGYVDPSAATFHGNVNINADSSGSTGAGAGNLTVAGTISSGSITAGTFVSATDYMRVTASGGAKNILLGNQDSGGVNKPAIIQGVNGRLRLGHGNSWTTTGGTFTTAIDLVNNNLTISTGALIMGVSTVIDSSRNVSNVTLTHGTSGAKLKADGWHYDHNNEARFYFQNSASNTGRSYYRADGGHHFRANGDVTRLTINQSGGINLLSAGETQVGSTVAIGVAGTTVLDTSRNLTNIGTISSGAITTTGITVDSRLVIDGSKIYDNSTNGNSKGFRIGGAGFVPLNGVGTDINNVVDIGTSTYRFKNLYLSGTISSGAITLSSDSSDMGFGTAKAGSTIAHTASVDEGIFWHTTNQYGIYRTSGAWSSPNYQQLKLKWDTGIEIDGNGTTYGKSGINFLNGNIKMDGTQILDSSRNLTNIGNITTTGTVLIGTDSGDSFNSNSALRLQKANHNYLQIKTPTNKQAGVLIGDTDDDFVGGFIYNNNDNQMTWTVNNTTALTISSSQNSTFYGNITVQKTGADSIIDVLGNSAYDSVLNLRSDQGGIASEGFQIWYDNNVGDVHLHTTYPNDVSAIRFHTRTGTDKATNNERFAIEGGGDINVVSGDLKFGGTEMVNANGWYRTAINPNTHDAVSGTWNSSSTSNSWGNIKVGTVGYAYTDTVGGYKQYNLPTNAQTAYMSHLKWNTGGYIDVHGVQSDGGLVFLCRVSTHQNIENSNEGNVANHDGQEIRCIGTRLGTASFTAIRLTNRSGRFHFTGVAFTNQNVENADNGIYVGEQIKSGNLSGIGTISSGAITTSAGLTASSTIIVNQPSSNTANELLILEANDVYSDVIQTDTGGSVRLRTNSGAYRIYTGGAATSQYASGATQALILDSSQNATFAGTISSGRIFPAGIDLSIDTGLYNQNAAISYYAASNAVYVNGAGPSGWLRLQAAGTENDHNGINIFGSTSGARIDFRTGNVQRLRISSSGDIQLGSSATTVIDSSRNGVFVNLRADGGNLIMGDEAYSASAQYVGMKTALMSGTNDYMIISGTTDPDTYVSAKDGAAVNIRGGGNNSGNQISVPDGSTISATTSDFRVSGNITAYVSDKRLKTNIKTIKNPIEKIKKIRGVEFDWLDNIENFNPKFEHETGVIAQEIEEVIPDAVSPAPFNEEYKTVDKEKIVALLIEGMKDQQELIEKLTARIEELEK